MSPPPHTHTLGSPRVPFSRFPRPFPLPSPPRSAPPRPAAAPCRPCCAAGGPGRAGRCRRHAGHDQELPAEHGGGMAPPGAEEGGEGVGMGMTAPVSITAFPAEDGSLQQKVKVYLRIPNQFQASPPCPSDESIKIEERQGMTIYSTQFGGYAKEVDYVNYAAKLKSALGSEATYRKDFYFCNGYDPPMKPYGRRNECVQESTISVI
uniref:Heme-binding protein 1 n=1 Tax=Anser cygnoides TaxID=8845 RepID=A0A8B9IPL5_ANSCY